MHAPLYLVPTPETIGKLRVHRYSMHSLPRPGGGDGVVRGVLPYMGNADMGSPKGYGFLAIFVRNSVSILAIIASNRAWSLHFSLILNWTCLLKTSQQHYGTVYQAGLKQGGNSTVRF